MQRLASFPDSFVFLGKFEERWARIGNSVPPLLMRAVAAQVRDTLTLSRDSAPAAAPTTPPRPSASPARARRASARL